MKFQYRIKTKKLFCRETFRNYILPNSKLMNTNISVRTVEPLCYNVTNCYKQFLPVRNAYDTRYEVNFSLNTNFLSIKFNLKLVASFILFNIGFKHIFLLKR